MAAIQCRHSLVNRMRGDSITEKSGIFMSESQLPSLGVSVHEPATTDYGSIDYQLQD